MSAPDRRSYPANARIAYHGAIDAPEDLPRTDGIKMSVAVPVADLRRAAGGARDRQLLLGEGFRVLETVDGWCFGFAEKNGYCGYIAVAALGPRIAPTHMVSARATHLYPEPDFKTEAATALSLGSLLDVTAGDDPRFSQTSSGDYACTRHLAVNTTDPAGVAERLLGTPYLWGGDSAFGIDCSGLVQLSFRLCGIQTPGDSDQQERWFGAPVLDRQYHRNDLLFWKGHVAIVFDAETLIHANAHDMAVALEPINAAIKRISEQGDGEVTAHKRITLSDHAL